MTTLIRCPYCNQLRKPSAPCAGCALLRQRRRRALHLLLGAAAILGLCLLSLLLSSCSPGDDAGGIQPPPRRTLAEIRAESLGLSPATPIPASSPLPIPTVLIPGALPADERGWALTNGQDVRWCVAGRLYGGAWPQDNHPVCRQ